MTKTRFTLNLMAAFVLLVAGSSLVHAQATRTWVSGTGDDVNPCSRTAPCKTFAGAISKTAEGGEIDALDPAGYGTLTITKAITVDGGTGSGWASVLASGTNGINVNIATSGITHINDAVVILRNISFQGVSQDPTVAAGINGVSFVRGARLYVENCQFENFSTSGINVNLTTLTGSLFVEDCFFDNVGTAVLSNASGGVISIIQYEHNRASGNVDGLNANTSTFASVRDSYFGGNTGSVNGSVRAGAGCTANVENSMFTNNIIGVNAAGGTIRISNNDFFNNTTAINNAGTVATALNTNKFSGNTSDGTTNASITLK